VRQQARRRGNAPVAQAPADDRLRGGAAPRATGEKRYATGKNPVLAVVLSLIITGVGQFYNGDIKKGAVMLVGAIVLAIATGGIGVLPVWIWSMYDAYQVANGKMAIW